MNLLVLFTWFIIHGLSSTLGNLLVSNYKVILIGNVSLVLEQVPAFSLLACLSQCHSRDYCSFVEYETEDHKCSIMDMKAIDRTNTPTRRVYANMYHCKYGQFPQSFTSQCNIIFAQLTLERNTFSTVILCYR